MHCVLVSKRLSDATGQPKSVREVTLKSRIQPKQNILNSWAPLFLLIGNICFRDTGAWYGRVQQYQVLHHTFLKVHLLICIDVLVLPNEQNYSSNEFLIRSTNAIEEISPQRCNAVRHISSSFDSFQAPPTTDSPYSCIYVCAHHIYTVKQKCFGPHLFKPRRLLNVTHTIVDTI